MSEQTPAVEWWAIERLCAHPDNYRHHPARQLVELRESLRRRGWRKVSISARPSDGLMMTGHGMLQAALSEGLQTVPVMPYECSDEEAKAWLVADNELSRPELVEDDRALLRDLLGDIESTVGLGGVGWSGDELEDLYRQLEGDIEQLADQRPEIHRERTALSRSSLSIGVAALQRFGYLDGSLDFIDFGCGKGDDLRAVQELGVNAVGWDPHFAPDQKLKRAAVVNLGFVVNVIEDIEERRDAVRRAFKLSGKVLAVSAMIGSPKVGQQSYADGVVTSAGTFEKLFVSNEELRTFVAELVGGPVVIVEAGVVFAFRKRPHYTDASVLEDWQERKRRVDFAGRQLVVEDDQAMQLLAKWKVEAGDRWRCGEHLVICGDSFELFPDVLEGVEADCMLTDPPYAIFGSSTGADSEEVDDRISAPFYRRVWELGAKSLRWYAHGYAFLDWRSWSASWGAARAEQMTIKNALIWQKDGAGLGSMYSNGHEMIAFAVKQPRRKVVRVGSSKGGTLHNNPGRHRTVNRPNIMRANRPTSSKGDRFEHNASKPVDLLCRLLTNSTDSGELVIDPFCGSGSTLIACSQMGRRCVTADIEPKWVAVALERWATLTGEQPVKG